jgi:hypothetical protein
LQLDHGRNQSNDCDVPIASKSYPIIIVPVDDMKIKSLILLTIATCTLVSAPVQAQAADAKKVDEFGDVKAGNAAVNVQNLPVISNTDWRSEKARIPWSTPVLVRDDFEGDYLAVLDRNYENDALSGFETGVITNWSRRKLRIYSYDTVKSCNVLFCKKRNVAGREAKKVAIKAGSQIFRLNGVDGNFELSEAVASALKNSPAGDTKIKIQFEESGVEIVSDIGKGTVAAWKTVYQDATDKPVAKSAAAVKPKK